jgi:hypothetical protein
MSEGQHSDGLLLLDSVFDQCKCLASSTGSVSKRGRMPLYLQVALGNLIAVAVVATCYSAYVFRRPIYKTIANVAYPIAAPIWRHRTAIGLTIGVALSTAAFLAWKNEQVRAERLYRASPPYGLSWARTKAHISCWMARKAHRYSAPFDQQFDVWKKIVDTPYERYYESFSGTRNEEHFQLIKAEVDCEIAADR